jgi:hypothetical protein
MPASGRRRRAFRVLLAAALPAAVVVTVAALNFLYDVDAPLSAKKLAAARK